mmetsp:Transcript_27028/g.56607  ORF Transcript_27028/g.56607 Transcript_27028/m.56607 type:complete len:295 (+) Transcript_27028:1368-2252(+)
MYSYNVSLRQPIRSKFISRTLFLFIHVLVVLFFFGSLFTILIFGSHGMLDSQSIETIPWIFLVNSQANPLCDNLFLPFKHGTAGMFRKTGIHYACFRVNVGKENGVSTLWLNMDARIAEIGVTTLICHRTIHNHGGHASSLFMRQSGTITVAVRSISIRFRIIFSTPLVLNAHQIFLSMFFNVQPQHVVRIVVDTTTQTGNGVAIFFLLPVHRDTSLQRFAVFAVLGSSSSIGDGGPVQTFFGRFFHGDAFIFHDKIFNHMNFGCGTFVLNLYATRACSGVLIMTPHFLFNGGR